MRRDEMRRDERFVTGLTTSKLVNNSVLFVICFLKNKQINDHYTTSASFLMRITFQSLSWHLTHHKTKEVSKLALTEGKWDELFASIV